MATYSIKGDCKWATRHHFLGLTRVVNDRLMVLEIK